MKTPGTRNPLLARALAVLPILAAAAISAPAGGEPAAEPAPRPVGWWRFEEDEDDPVILDSTGVSGDGEIFSETVFRDSDAPFGPALAFLPPEEDGRLPDGADAGARAAVPGFPASALGDAFTVALWIAPDAAPPAGASASILGWSDASEPPRGFEVSLGGDLRLRASGIPLGPALEPGEWVHAAFARDGGTLALYIDGAPAATAPFAAPPADGDAPLCIGDTGPAEGLSPFEGAIADLRVYSSALSPSQIASIAGAASNPGDNPDDTGAPSSADARQTVGDSGADLGDASRNQPRTTSSSASAILRAPSPGASSATTDTDSDSDGMPDDWESLYGLDPRDPSDAAADPDGDGVTNLREYRLGRDPRAPAVAPDEPLIHLF